MRKMTSISTLGLVDFRSDKERTAKYTRDTRDATREAIEAQEAAAKYARQTRNATRVTVVQNMMMLDQQRRQLAQDRVHHVESQANAHILAGGQQQQSWPEPQQIAPQAPPPYVPDSIPAGWYDDGNGTTRWYDGQRWTPHTR
ncbi:hypothetical protein BJ983_005281 [Actinomycetospora corticicola]|uniref:DUF2510 domain-containing protein n=2 Tax=Actinomycetospora corticicola TaxID=663602 RepID=A0A7Y9E132_9PSEU|nr:hypothetical protein [Actinomycetospora corticicola]